jgi:hypothetical protein
MGFSRVFSRLKRRVRMLVISGGRVMRFDRGVSEAIERERRARYAMVRAMMRAMIRLGVDDEVDEEKGHNDQEYLSPQTTLLCGAWYTRDIFSLH